MKRILFAAAVWLFGCAAAWAQQTGPIYCGQIANVSLVAATSTIVVPSFGTLGTPGTAQNTVAGSPRIYVCGYSLSVVGATGGTLTFTAATGTTAGAPACPTATAVAIGPSIWVPATNTITDSSPVFRGFEVPPGNALCASGAVATLLTLYYAQY